MNRRLETRLYRQVDLLWKSMVRAAKHPHGILLIRYALKQEDAAQTARKALAALARRKNREGRFAKHALELVLRRLSRPIQRRRARRTYWGVS